MDLAIGDRVVEKIDVTFSVDLTLSGGYHLRVESPMSIGSAEGALALDPEQSTTETINDGLAGLMGATVTSAESSETGALVVVFTPATTLRVEPDENYESWALSGPRGHRVICLPGGELAIWEPEQT